MSDASLITSLYLPFNHYTIWSPTIWFIWLMCHWWKFYFYFYFFSILNSCPVRSRLTPLYSWLPSTHFLLSSHLFSFSLSAASSLCVSLFVSRTIWLCLFLSVFDVNLSRSLSISFSLTDWLSLSLFHSLFHSLLLPPCPLSIIWMVSRENHP